MSRTLNASHRGRCSAPRGAQAFRSAVNLDLARDLQGLCHGNLLGDAGRVNQGGRSRSRGRDVPIVSSVCPEQAQRAAGEKVALEREGVVNGGMHAEEALS